MKYAVINLMSPVWEVTFVFRFLISPLILWVFISHFLLDGSGSELERQLEGCWFNPPTPSSEMSTVTIYFFIRVK